MAVTRDVYEELADLIVRLKVVLGQLETGPTAEPKFTAVAGQGRGSRKPPAKPDDGAVA